MNNVLNVEFATPAEDEVRLTSKFVRSFSLRRFLKGLEDFSLNGIEVLKSCKM